MILYLASQSPRRKEILKQMKIRFHVVSSRYEENPKEHLKPRALVQYHALRKAKQAVLPKGARWVLGADTEVCLGGKIFGKPKSMKEAVKMLEALSGKRHDVLTGIVLLDLKEGVGYEGYERTHVYFKKLSLPVIHQYFKKVNPFDKAGAYAIQEDASIIQKIKGSRSNVIGLPKELLTRMLKRARFLSQWKNREE